MPVLARYRELLIVQHDAARQAIHGLPQEVLDWRSEHVKNSLGVLAALPEGDLGASRPLDTAVGSKEVEVAWDLFHVLEHTAYHAGQMNVLHKLWRDRTGESA